LTALTADCADTTAALLSGFKAMFGVKVTSAGENVLQFQFETKTQGSPGDPFVWSPDGRRLLSGMTMRDSSGEVQASLWLFDVADDKAVGHRVLDGRGTATAGIAWSPDGESLAIIQSDKIRVFSVPDFKEIARREIAAGDPELDNLQRINLPTGVAFSKDSKSLWIARPAENVRNRFTLAVQLDAQSLSVIEHYDIDPPIAGNRTVASRTTIESTPNGPRLVALVDSYTGIKNVFQGDTARHFAYGVDLADKVELFPHFELVEDGAPFLNPWRVLLSPSADIVVVPLSHLSNPKIVPTIQQERDVDVYETKTGQRVSL
jgi:dipeptidyl aminopeptidase/acylaminoacyl peptidase